MNSALLPDGDSADISEAVRAGRKLDAIERYRQLTGASREEASRAIDALERDLRVDFPERAGDTTSREIRLLVLGILGLLALAAAQYFHFT